jgi:hypothetical protein
MATNSNGKITHLDPRGAVLWLLATQHPQPVFLGAFTLANAGAPNALQAEMVALLCDLEKEGLIIVALEEKSTVVTLTDKGVVAAQQHF